MYKVIAVYKVSEDEAKKLLQLNDELKRNVIGQDDAIDILAKSIRRSRKSYSTSDDADLSFLFPFFLILIGLIVISNVF
jgi:ATP-dependent Clp protease ATP-binding subunit ClpA